MISGFTLVLNPNERTTVWKSEVEDTLVHIRAVEGAWIGDENVEVNLGYYARSQWPNEFRMANGDVMCAICNKLTYIYVMVQVKKG